MFKTENLTLTGVWQNVTKDFEVKSFALRSKNGNDIEIRKPSTASSFVLEGGQTLSLDNENTSQEYTFQVKGTLADVCEIIKQY